MSTALTTVTANRLQDATGTLIDNATISFLPVANNGSPISFRAGTAAGQSPATPGQVVSEAVSTQIAAGVFGIQLADTSLTSPVNVGYRVTVTDNATGKVLLAKGYECIQPTGGAWSLDDYVPNLAAQVTVQAGPPGAPGLSAYQTWLLAGNTGSVSDFLASLVGPGGGFGKASAATVADYDAANLSNAANQTALNPGVTYYQDANQAAGSDFGFIASRGYYNRSFGKQFGFATMTARPGAQADFSLLAFLNGTSFDLYPDSAGANPKFSVDLYGNIKAAGLIIPTGNFRVDSDGNVVLNSAKVGNRYVTAQGNYADASQYVTFNPAGHANSGSGGALNGGFSVYSDNGSAWGLDMGWSSASQYNVRAFAPGLRPFTWATVSNLPSTQGDFTEYARIGAQVGFQMFYDASGNNAKFSVDVNGNVTAQSIALAAGPLTIIGGAMTFAGQTPQSQASIPTASTTLLQAYTLAATQRYAPPTYPNAGSPTSWTGLPYATYGDSITAGAFVTQSQVYGGLVAAALGANFTNYGVGGDQVADTTRHILTNENFSAAARRLTSLQIGTNDANNKGTGAYEAVFNSAYLASLAMLAIGNEYRVAGGSVTGSNWSLDGNSAFLGTLSSTSGASLTYSVTTYGKPIYLIYQIADGNAGTFTVAIDGGAAVAYSCASPTPIATAAGSTACAAFARIPVPPGVHSVVVTVTSATGSGNVVHVNGFLTPPPHCYYTTTVLVGLVLPQNSDLHQSVTAQYSLDAYNNIRELQADGLDLRLVNNRDALLNGQPDHYNDQLHPNVVGHLGLSQPYILAALAAPAPSVNRSTPLGSNRTGHPGDTWSDGTYDYLVNPAGIITRTAATYSTW